MGKKVCIVSYRFPPEYSGAGKRAAEFAEYLMNCGFHVKIITSKNTINKPDNSGKFDILYYCRNHFRFPFRRIIESIDLLVKMYMMKNYFDYVFIYGSHGLAASLLKLLNKKIIYRATLIDDDDLFYLSSNRYYGWYFRILNKMIDYHWIISKEMGTGLIEMGVPEWRVIYSPNGVNSENISHDRANTNKEESIRGRKNFLFIGEISYRKGTDLLINLFQHIVKRYPDARLNICGLVGSQELYRKLIALPNTIYNGVVKNIYSVIEENDLFLYPSRQEGFPTALIEAMSNGLLCITSKLPVIKDEIIDHGLDGYCLDFQDITETMELISRLLGDEALREAVSKNAVNKVKSRFMNSDNFAKILKVVT